MAMAVMISPITTHAMGGSPPAEVTVAVSANALSAVREISEAYTRKTGVEVKLVAGSTGRLFSQILQGAPFDVFLSADDVHTALLEGKGLTVKGSRFAYAQGVLVAYSPDKGLDLKKYGLEILTDKSVRRISIANPKTAPYGRAAVSALKYAGLWEKVKDKLVYGESVSQAFSFARTGNAEVALVARSLTTGEEDQTFVIDNDSYGAIVQECVILKDADTLSKGFTEFLKSPEARSLLKKYGYLIP